jgi:hypothetical protein
MIPMCVNEYFTGGIVSSNKPIGASPRRDYVLTRMVLGILVGEWRKQCFLRFLVRGIRPKQANTIFSTIF